MTAQAPMRTSKVCTLCVDLAALQLTVEVPSDVNEGDLVDLIDESITVDLLNLELALVRAGICVQNLEVDPCSGEWYCSVEEVTPTEG